MHTTASYRMNTERTACSCKRCYITDGLCINNLAKRFLLCSSFWRSIGLRLIHGSTCGTERDKRIFASACIGRVRRLMVSINLKTCGMDSCGEGTLCAEDVASCLRWEMVGN